MGVTERLEVEEDAGLERTDDVVCRVGWTCCLSDLPIPPLLLCAVATAVVVDEDLNDGDAINLEFSAPQTNGKSRCREFLVQRKILELY